jgi:hypothetical protein
MRILLPLAVGVSLAIFPAAGCGGGFGTVGGDPDGGGSPEGSPHEDGATADGAVDDSAAITDGSASDGDVACGIKGGTYDKTCASASDCTTVARGCYCGAQPVVGIAKSAGAGAQACETKAGMDCPLGCANFPGHVAEDGQNDEDGGAIQVFCDNKQCHTAIR